MGLSGIHCRLSMCWLGGSILVLILISCATALRLPEVDLSAPGWQVWTGQALWKAEAGRTAIAGDILLAHHTNGDVLISFAKPPVSIFTAQTYKDLWLIDFIYSQRRHSGKGSPPSRFVWFQIPAILQEKAEPKGWQIHAETESVWELQNSDTGEYIRLVLFK